jgi:hypothetical protein
MREPRTELYSPFGLPADRFAAATCALKVVIDPLREYFGEPLREDQERFDRILLIHGCEPPEVNDIRDLVIANAARFSRICSFDPAVLAACPGSELFCFGSCWVLDEHLAAANPFKPAKEFEVSYVRSTKRQLAGHLFRDQIEAALRPPHRFRLQYPREWIPDKRPLFTHAMFHIAAENSRHPNYFTEKLVDCMVSYTVPLYWGCPNIGDYFDPAGVLAFETGDELAEILARLRPEDYFDRLPAVEENCRRAVRDYAFFFLRMNRLIAREGAAAALSPR